MLMPADSFPQHPRLAEEALSKIAQQGVSSSPIDQIGFGRFHCLLFLVCGIGWMADASSSSVLSYLLPTLRDEWGISTEQEGDLGSVAACGQALGALTFGALSDYYGRRPSFIASVTLSAVFGVATAAAPSYAWMMALRFSAGFAFGGNLPLAVSLVTEFFPSSHRSQALIMLQLFMELGALLATFMAYLVLDSNWRLFLILTAVPSMAAILLVWQVPESPEFLLGQGRSEEANTVLTLIASVNGNQLWTVLGKDEEAGKESDGAVEHSNEDAPSSFQLLISVEVFGPLCAMVVIWFAGMIGSGWYMWVVDVADRVHLKELSYWLMIATRIVVVVSFTLVSLIVGRVSTQALTLASFVGVSIASMLFTVTLCNIQPVAWQFCTTFLCYAFTFGAAWPLIYVISPTFFPTAVRVTAVAISSASSKVGSVVQPQIAGHLMDSSLFSTGVLFSSGWIVCCIALAYIFARCKVFI